MALIDIARKVLKQNNNRPMVLMYCEYKRGDEDGKEFG